ncbi:MAG: hypothetical protein ACRCRZ_00745, partial [Metamycoplasmataceae bacterium]
NITFGPNDTSDKVTQVNPVALNDPKIKEFYDAIGVSLKYKFGPSSSNPADNEFIIDWKTDLSNNPQDLGSPKTMYLKFFIKDTNSQNFITLSTNSKIITKTGDQLVIPQLISVDLDNLKKIILDGSSINMTFDETQAMVDATGNASDILLQNVHILYSINDLTLDSANPNKKEFTQEELKELLPKYKGNILPSDLDKISAKYAIKTDLDKYSLGSNNIFVTIGATNVKSFIHMNEYYQALVDKKNIEITGSTTDNIGNIIFPFDVDKFKELTKIGIQIEWTTDNDNVQGNPDDKTWTVYNFEDSSTHPKDIGNNPPYLAMRFSSSNIRVIMDDTIDKKMVVVTPTNLKIFYNVDTKVIKDNILLNGNTKILDSINEKPVLDTYPDYLYLEIEYSIGANEGIALDANNPDKKWFTAKEFKDALLKYNNEIYGQDRIVRARFVVNQEGINNPPAGFVFEIKNIGASSVILDLTNFKSYIDVSAELNKIKNDFIEFGPNDTTGNITEITKIGLSNEEIKNIFTDKGLKAELAVNSEISPNFDYSWKPGDNTKLPGALGRDEKGNLLMWKFTTDSKNDIVLDFNTNDISSSIIRTKVKIPTLITLDPDTALVPIINSIGGNTKHIEINTTDEKNIISAIKTNNNTPNAEIEIQYSIKNIELTPGKIWFNSSDFKKLLSERVIDFNTNEIKARFFIDPNFVDASGDTYKLSSEKEVEIHAENITDSAKVKIFINKSDYAEQTSNIKIKGQTNNFEITLPNKLISEDKGGILSPGLELVWTIDKDAKIEDIHDEAIWTSIVPTIIDPTTKYLAVAFRVKPGYEFELAPQKYEIDTTNIFTFIEVKNEWLNLISFTGNTINAKIDETNLQNELVMPGGDKVIVQYTFNGTEWFTKDEFPAKLKATEGALDKNNFILLRDSIKARYSIDSEESFKDYRLKVDGQEFIDTHFVNDPLKFVSIMNSPHNDQFKGYINLDKIAFEDNSFKITGTNLEPVLNILNNTLEAMLAPYKNPTLIPFEIYYTTQKDANGKGVYTFDDNHLIFGEQGFKTTGFDAISNVLNDQYFGLIFKAKSKYVVAKNDIIQNEGYELTKIQIDIRTIIDSPFSGPLDVRFVDEKNEKFYQGEGSFTLWNNTDLATSILDAHANGILVDQYKIEYHVSNDKYSEQELIDVKQDNTKWTTELPTNLKVGQYVMARIRVVEGSKIIINNIEKSDTPQIKVIGLKVKMSDIKINDNISLRNRQYSSIDSPIDGDAYISSTNVIADAKDNYLGVDLTLETDTDFYIKNGKIYLHDGLPVVKRAKGSDEKRTNLGVLDDSGQEIVIERDENGIPTAPIKTGIWKSWDLSRLTNGYFQFIPSESLGGMLFNNQTIKIKAKIADDFIADDLTINPELEYTVKNAKYLIFVSNTAINIDPSTSEDITYAPNIESEKEPINGASHISSSIKLSFKNDGSDTSEIFAGEEAFKQLQERSQNQLTMEVTWIPKTGSNKSFIGWNWGREFTELKNGDKIVIKIVASNPQFVFAENIVTTITVKGLAVPSPDKEIMKELRIVTNDKPSTNNGFGFFYATIQTTPGEDNSSSRLPDLEFSYRVWNADKTLKTNWTPDKNKINGLVNGDKIEWRLVSKDGNPVALDYYNTIADPSSPSGFIITNVNEKGEITNIDGIGNYLENEDTGTYPENSGYTIHLLGNPIVAPFEIDSLLQKFQLKYFGIDGTGNFDIASGISESEMKLLNDAGYYLLFSIESELKVPKKTNDLKNGDIITLTLRYKKPGTNENYNIINNSEKKFQVNGLEVSENLAPSALIISLSAGGGLLAILLIAGITYKVLRDRKISGNRKFRK